MLYPVHTVAVQPPRPPFPASRGRGQMLLVAFFRLPRAGRYLRRCLRKVLAGVRTVSTDGREVHGPGTHRLDGGLTVIYEAGVL